MSKSITRFLPGLTDWLRFRTASVVVGLLIGCGCAAVSAGAGSFGSLKGFGSIAYGQLGDGELGYFVTASLGTQVGINAAHAQAGLYHSLWLKSDGTLWAIGQNASGQVGDGTLVAKDYWVQIDTGVSSISAGQYDSFYVKSNGSLWAM